MSVSDNLKACLLYENPRDIIYRYHALYSSFLLETLTDLPKICRKDEYLVNNKSFLQAKCFAYLCSVAKKEGILILSARYKII